MSPPAAPASGSTSPDAPGPPPVCVIVSRYNDEVTGALRDVAVATYVERGGGEDRLGVIDAPGAFELVALASTAVESGLYEGVCCLGCVVRGQTDHDRYISQAIASGLADISAATGVPVTFGVITANTADQARARAGGSHGNKGAEAMHALLDVLEAQEALAEAALAEVPGFRFELNRAAPGKPKDAS
jgi:6,7-dimethyl-8-ribityllumazine synthase